MNKVYLENIKTYDFDLIQKTIEERLNDLGFLARIKKEESVFVKLNLVGPFEQKTAITTNAIILDAVLTILEKKTTNIIVGDNPATKDQIYVMKKSGLYEVIARHNVRILNQEKISPIKSEKAKMYKEFMVTSEMVECDYLVNLPKVKCHSLTYMSCCEKNFFGLIYGLNKSAWHTKASNPKDFAILINDLYTCLSDVYQDRIIHIADGIIALEGDGPSTGGRPKEMGALIIGDNAINCDIVACKVGHLNIDKCSLTQEAIARGLNSEFEIVGNIDDFNDVHLDEPVKALPIKAMGLLKLKTVRNMLCEHPVIDKSICIKCKECHKICPAKAMQFDKDKGPYVKTRMCIRCWCCAEVCPQAAISKSKRPLIGRIILK